MNPGGTVPLAVVERSGAVESVHHGVVVVLGVAGDVIAQAGDPTMLVYPRSSNKPFQAVGMVEAGLELDVAQLAVACSSHWGTPRHVSVVQSVLDRYGIDVAALANTPDLPLDRPAAEQILRSGGGPSSLTMTCSGKHAAMLATCLVNGWPTDASYLDPDHPLQRHLTEVVTRLAEEPMAGVGVDGCGAPALRFGLLGLARAVRAVATGAPGSAEGAVAHAMTTHPDLVGGAGCEATMFMPCVPGLVVKDGAEGVLVAGLSDGRTVVLKIADGSVRARAVVLAAGLAAAGIDVDAFAEVWHVPVMGHGRPVGSVRAAGAAAEWLGMSGAVDEH